MQRKRYAVVGAGGRGIGMFAKPIMSDFKDTAELVALVDNNPIRMAYGASRLPGPVSQYTDFDRMMKECDPDCVIAATRDCFHADYVVKALKAGKRAYSEKPLCTTAAQCRAILAAAKSSGQVMLTTHNARYGAGNRAVKEVIKSGRLGDILHMQYEETLDRRHGADYFRRWHRNKANSGGLQIHKASHHFDLLNWWAGSKPVTLAAQGGLRFYGRNGPFRGRRCLGCKHAKKCAFYAPMYDFEEYRKAYLEAEKADGYIRDGCVFDKSIDIEDQLAVQYTYANGIQVNYSLVAYSPIETHRVVIEGTKGRLEAYGLYNTGWAISSTTLQGLDKLTGESVKLYIPNGGVEDVSLKRVAGGHGGADPQLRADFFGRDWKKPANEMMASLDQAVQAVLIGCAINKSLATGKPVDVQGLLKKD
ncbi:MAG: Gfo/Idh/MocA family protein [Phycisphaerae bacterium]